MRMRMRRWLRPLTGEKGSVLTLVALSMVVLLGFVALATDAGLLYLERQRLNNVADVAALAAVQFLPDDPEGAEAAAREYLEKNGITAGQGSVHVDPAENRVVVSAESEVPLLFAPVIGHTQATVAGGGAAMVAPLSGVQGAVPLGVAQADWKLGEQVVLKLSANDGTVAPGNYQALALGRRGSSVYEHNLMYGYPEWIRIGDWIETEPGNMASPSVRAARYRIGLDPLATWETVQPGSPRLLLVPILKDFTVNGRGEVQVVGFAMFFLENVEEKGPDKGEITGRFLRMAAEGEIDSGAPYFGVTRAKLIR